MMLDELTYDLQDLIDKLERQMAERVGYGTSGLYRHNKDSKREA